MIEEIREHHREYLSDESHLTGDAQSISFPGSESEILKTLNTLKQKNIPVTIQGSNSGIAGCCVPMGGHIVNLSRMDTIGKLIPSENGEYFLKVQPGVTVAELKDQLQRMGHPVKLFWPPDPTESSASVGGIVSCGAAGITSYLYGDTRRYIEALRILTSDGKFRNIRKIVDTIEVDGERRAIFDLFFRGEGMFGVITEVTLKLIARPGCRWGVCFFFDDRKSSLLFGDVLQNTAIDVPGAAIAAMEYIDRASLDLVAARSPTAQPLRELPKIEPDVFSLIYVEIHGADEQPVEAIAGTLLELAVECNCDPDMTWAVTTEAELVKIHGLRHSVPESVNLFIGAKKRDVPGITKLGTDMQLPSSSFSEVVTYYEKSIQQAGLHACIFGHIGSNHLHVNFLPEDTQESTKAKTLIAQWAQEIGKKGGSAITEHGVGKLKKDIFLATVDHRDLTTLKKAKIRLDPSGMWNPSNMIG